MRRWWRRRRTARRDECEVCGKELKPRQARHLTSTGTNEDINEVGGWAMTATYCRQHAPEGARRGR